MTEPHIERTDRWLYRWRVYYPGRLDQTLHVTLLGARLARLWGRR